MKKRRTRRFRVGDIVKIIKIPSGLTDPAGIGTAKVFRRALGKTFRIEGFHTYGHIEIIVREHRRSPNRYQSDTIWIEPEFVRLAETRPKPKQTSKKSLQRVRTAISP